MSDDDDIDDAFLALSLRSLVEQLPFDVWIRDEKDKILFANEAARRHREGSVGRTVDASDVRDETGIRGTVGINLDVTGEKRARVEAQNLGQLLRHVVESTTVAMGLRAVRGEDLVHVEDNPRAAALMGSTSEALRGLSDRELGVPPERTSSRYRSSSRSGAPAPTRCWRDFAKRRGLSFAQSGCSGTCGRSPSARTWAARRLTSTLRSTW